MLNNYYPYMLQEFRAQEAKEDLRKYYAKKAGFAAFRFLFELLRKRGKI